MHWTSLGRPAADMVEAALDEKPIEHGVTTYLMEFNQRLVPVPRQLLPFDQLIGGNGAREATRR